MKENEHLKIFYEHKEKNIVQAKVKNCYTGRVFILSNYSNIGKANILAPKLLKKKLENPSLDFQNFKKK